MSMDDQRSAYSRLKSHCESIIRSRKVHEFTQSKTNLLGLGIVLFLAIAAVFAPVLAPYSPTEQNIEDHLHPPSSEHLMGTDQLGRDMFTRVLYCSVE